MAPLPTDYDEYASTYAWTRHAVPWVVAPLTRVLVELRPRSMVLDIGCGTGNYTRALADGRRDVAFIGFDLSQQMLREAPRRPGGAFVAGDASGAFPFRDRTFGFAFAVDVVHHIRDLVTFFGEAARVLRPGGRLLLVTDSEETLRERSLTAFFPETLAIEVARYPPTPVLHQRAREAGLSLVEEERAEGRIPLSDDFLRSLDAKCSSALRLVAPSDHERGMARLRAAQARGEQWRSSYLVLHYGVSDPSRSSLAGGRGPHRLA